MTQPEFLPTTRDEMSALGWDELDILLISGDAYVDSHSFAMSLLGRWLLAHGYKTGIIAQPDWQSADDIGRMGRPLLFAGVSAGSVDSLIAHYTAFRKKRHSDAYTPGGKLDCRPNRASIVYTGLVRQAFPGLPVVLGGIEASLRRASHYDFWSDQLRRSILLDSKADAILYGMGEKSILDIAALFSSPAARQRPAAALEQARIKGTVYAVHPDRVSEEVDVLPSHEAILADPPLLIKATLAFERQMLHQNPCLIQRSASRVVVFEPPAAPLSTEEMDRVYSLPFTGRAHPSYSEPIPAVAMLEGSVTSHRGCGGGCSFCSLASHQGRAIQSRSRESILREVAELTHRPGWKGSITDIGGPTSNMWNTHCAGDVAVCKRESCLYPKRCRHFKPSQAEQVELLRAAAQVDGVSHVRVASGVRHDMALESEEYMQALVGEFTGGQLKIAPEHITEKVLRLMRKPSLKTWDAFIKQFSKRSEEVGKEQYIIPYLMSGFPGCTDEDMEQLAAWLRKRGWRPQQVQCFIPSPGTVATAMFFAGVDEEGRPLFVAREDADRLRQHGILMPSEEHSSGSDGRPARRDSRPRPQGQGGFQRGPRREQSDRGERRGGGFAPRGDRRPDSGGGRGERFGGPRPERKFDSEKRGDRFAPRGDRRPDSGGGRGDRFGGPRPERKFDGEQRGERFGGPRPERKFDSEKRGDRLAPRSDRRPASGDSRGDRFSGPRPERKFDSEKRGDRLAPRSDRRPASGDSRGDRFSGPRPERKFDSEKRGDRLAPRSDRRPASGDSRGDRFSGPRPERKFDNEKRGDRFAPRGDRRPASDDSRGDRFSGPRPERKFDSEKRGDRLAPRSDRRPASGDSRGDRFSGPRPERKFDNEKRGDRPAPRSDRRPASGDSRGDRFSGPRPERKFDSEKRGDRVAPRSDRRPASGDSRGDRFSGPRPERKFDNEKRGDRLAPRSDRRPASGDSRGDRFSGPRPERKFDSEKRGDRFAPRGDRRPDSGSGRGDRSGGPRPERKFDNEKRGDRFGPRREGDRPGPRGPSRPAYNGPRDDRSGPPRERPAGGGENRGNRIGPRPEGGPRHKPGGGQGGQFKRPGDRKPRPGDRPGGGPRKSRGPKRDDRS